MSIGLGMAIKAMNDEEKYNTKARLATFDANDVLTDAQLALRRDREAMEDSLTKLVNRKRGIVKTSIKKFVETLSPVMNILFDEKETLRAFSQNALIPSELLHELDTMIQFVAKPETKSNGTLAYILGGIPGLAINSLRQDAKNAEREYYAAKAVLSEAHAISAQSEAIRVSYYAIKERADRISDILTKLNVLFFRSINAAAEVIAEKGQDKSRYTYENIEYLRNCVNFAGGIKDIIQSPLIDQNGELTQRSQENIQAGNQLLAQMQSM